MYNAEIQSGRIQRFSCSRNLHGASHLLYADDMVIFTSGNINSMRNLMDTISRFCSASGQAFNNAKTRIFFGKGVRRSHRRSLREISECSEGCLPTTYLGCPLFKGRPRIDMFEGTIQKLIGRIAGWKASLLSSGGKVTLAQSVLSALPIHILSAIPVPKGVISRLERLICAFIWDVGGEKRRHWVKADTILQPYGNGGLNVRKLSEVLTSLHARLAWKVINRSSAWAKFMATKYEENRRSQRSSLWNRLWPVISRIKEDSLVEIRNGECPFWGSPWCFPALPKPPRCRFKGSVAQFLNSDSLKAQLMHTLPDYAQQALGHLQLRNEPDHWTWTRHSSGEVSVKNFYQFSTPRPPECKEWKRIWFSALPRKLCFLLWKIKHKIFMVDSFFQRKGFQLASKCNCCKLPQPESQDHLFVQGEIAQKIWSWAGDLSNIPYGARNLKSLWRDWFSNSNPNSLTGATNLLLFSAGLWEIWKFRCAVRFGDCAPILNELIIKLNWSSLVRARLPPIISSLKAPALPLTSLPVAWRTNAEAVTANLASKDHLIAFICRSRQGRMIGCGVTCFNQAFPVPGIREAIVRSRELCSQALSFSLQWDRDLSSFASRKWAAFASGVHGLLVHRSGNGVARALAREAAAGNITPAPLLCPQTLPQAILALIESEANAIAAGAPPQGQT